MRANLFFLNGYGAGAPNPTYAIGASISTVREYFHSLCARESGSIDGAPVADADDLDDQAVVFDRVHDAILSYPYPIGH